jgi:hypothetical protein
MSALSDLWGVIALPYRRAKLAAYEERIGLDSMGLPPPHPVGWCPGCGVLQRVDATGRVAAHDRPEPWVPFDQAPTPCTGSGQLSGGAT